MAETVGAPGMTCPRCSGALQSCDSDWLSECGDCGRRWPPPANLIRELAAARDLIGALEAQAVELRAEVDRLRMIVARLVAAFDRRPTLPALLVARDSPLMRDARALAVSPSTAAPTKEETDGAGAASPASTKE